MLENKLIEDICRAENSIGKCAQINGHNSYGN